MGIEADRQAALVGAREALEQWDTQEY